MRYSRATLALALKSCGLLGLGTLLSGQHPGFWETRPSMQTARQELACAVVGGKVYAGGGLGVNRASMKSFELFDPATNKWSSLPDLPTTLHHHGMAAIGTKIYVIGGYVSGFSGTDKCWVFDTVTKKWSAIQSLPRRRGALSAVVLDGKIYAVGGVVPFVGIVGDLTVYDPKTNKWATLAPMLQWREHLAAVALGGMLYAVGGRRGRNFEYLERYDPKTNKWTRLKSMPTARSGLGAAVLDGKILVMGGEIPGVYKQNEEYDPKTNTWRTLAPMQKPVHGIYAVTLNDEIFVAAGATIAGYQAVKTVQSFKRYPDGVRPYGTGTAACNGALTVLPSHKPIAGESRFSLLSSKLPANTLGFLALGFKADVTGSTVLGYRTHLDLSSRILLFPTRSTASGANTFPIPLPSGVTGGGFVQFLWANTASCGGAGTTSTSHGLEIRLR